MDQITELDNLIERIIQDTAANIIQVQLYFRVEGKKVQVPVICDFTISNKSTPTQNSTNKQQRIRFLCGRFAPCSSFCSFCS